MKKIRFISCTTILLTLAATAAPALAGSPFLRLTASDECVSATEIGDQITVTLELANTGGSLEVISFQSFLAFDATALSFVIGTYGPEWDDAQHVPISEDTAGELDLGAVHAFGSGPATGNPILFATLTFDVLATTDCDGTVVGFRTDAGGEVFGAVPPADPAPVSLLDGEDANPIVIDTTAPVLACPADTEVECGDSTDPADTGMATATDNCDDPDPFSGSITFADDTDGLADCVGGVFLITRTWTATDSCGNASTCDQVITVIDTTPPTLDFVPGPVTRECGASTDPADTGGPATASDTCGTAIVTFEDATESGADCETDKIFEIITRTWTATDDCGNSDTATQTITVEDTTPPSFDTDGVPDDVTIECGDSTAPADTGGPATASDICSGVTVAFVDTDGFSDCPAGDVFETITRTWTATDGCGNLTTTVQTITVEDTTPPGFDSVPADVTIECGDSTAPANTGGSATASDACSEVTITFVDSDGVGDCPPVDIITRTWIATDECGNASTATQIITEEDTTSPTFIAFPGDAAFQCEADVPAPDPGALTADDNCSLSGSITIEHVIDAPSGAGCADDKLIINRFYRATDECGNQSTRTQQFTVFDTISPTFDDVPCLPDFNLSCDANLTPSNLGTPDVSDNCTDGMIDLDFEDVFSGDVCDGTRTLTRTWTATDACQNSATCVQTVMLSDLNAPNIFCPGDSDSDGASSITILADAGECTATYDPGQATATDDCDPSPTVTGTRDDDMDLDDPYEGTVVITWTAEDCTGKTSTCTQTVIVTAENEVEATVELRGISAASVTRCIQFQLWTCDPLAGPTTIQEDVIFTNGVGTVTLTPTCGVYDCITARDPRHTMRRTAEMPSGGGDGNFVIVGTTYEADFTLAAGNDLIPGDLDNDLDVDTIDGGWFTLEFANNNNPGADTTCIMPAPLPGSTPTSFHADLDGDGIVGAFDFNLLFAQIFGASEANCCGQAGATEPDIDVAVEELERRGLHALVAVDLNHDGRLNLDDMVAFLGGARPGRPERPAEPERLRDGDWFDTSTWSGAVPDADADRRLDRAVVVERDGAIARGVEIVTGGVLRIAGGTLTAAELVVRAGGTLVLDGEDSLLSVGSLVLDDGAVLQWLGGVLEIAGGTLTQATPDLIVGTTDQMSVLSLIDGATATIARDVIVGRNGGIGVIEVIASTLSAGRVIQVGVDGEGWLELLDGGVAAAGDAIVVGPSGRITGTGELIGAVFNDGVLTPREMRISGSYFQSGELLIELGSTWREALLVDGTATLGGVLRIDASDGPAPLPGERLTIVWAERLDERRLLIERPAIPGRVVEIARRGDAIELNVRAAPERDAP